MKRVGILLLSAVALLFAFTLALAQLEARTAKYLLRVISGEDIRGYFGSDLTSAFPFTGDKPLFAVSATGEADGPVRTGQVFFYDGLLAEEPVLTITCAEEGNLFGWTLSGGGDWNGDSIPDLVVAAPAGQSGSVPPGKVYLYLGGSDFGRSPASILSAGETSDGFGEALSLEKDINGDGLADLIVGAPRSRKAGATAGRAYVWFGKSTGTPDKNPDIEIKLGTTNDLFGSAIAVGDLNADGQADLAIGAPHDKSGGNWVGSVFIFHGGTGLKLSAATQIISGEGTAFQDEYARSLAIVPDLNADKADELLVGAPQVSVGGQQLGRVYLYYGADKISSEPAMTFTGTAEAGRFGQKVYSLGDLNGDGKGDWAVQAEAETGGRGDIKLYYGGWEKEFYRFTGESVGDRLGNSLATLGDMDGNGTVDIVVGARWNDADGENAGRIYLLGVER